MKRILTGALVALTLAGGAAATATPASAEEWHEGWHGGGGWHEGGWRHDGGWGSGAAIGAGILGLAVGASLAADHPYYGGGYYGGGYYAPPPAYYGPPCHGAWRWNPYWGSYQRVRVCD